ncbi:MAG TPA: alpha/beta fold hydrolase [Polyangia bacterium]|jgi:polyhydroxyalkanoate synthase
MKRLWNLFTLGARPKPQVGVTPADVVHRENKWRLLHYRPRAGGAAATTPLLLVPSLINRHYVLDLMPGKSFVEYLVAQGHDVYAIDWGTPGDEDRYLSFDDVCDGYLGRAVRHCARHGARGRTHLLGYCLGGTLTAMYAARRPAHVASLTGIAAPVRFDDDGLLARWTRSQSFDVDALVAGAGNVPWQLMQSAFHMLRPTLPLSKAVHLLDRAWNDEYLDGFLALETWGNDNVSFPGECFKTLIRLYRDDAIVNERVVLAGRPVRLADVRCPTLAVTFEHDNIVPWRSAAELLERVGAPDRERIHLPGGHVGAVVSRAAAKALWPRLSAWWAARDTDAPVAVAAPAAPRKAAAKTARRAARRANT